MDYALDQKIAEILPELMGLRMDLHRIPEKGFAEHKTARLVSDYLRDLGLQVTTGIAGTGVLGLLKGSRPGPTLAIRTCLDGLEMEERSGVSYSSEHTGLFHGCGHDGNMTMALGAARILSEMKDRLPGTVKFIFQPSEEETGGAVAMIAAGVLEDPSVDAIFHIHNWHGLKRHALGIRGGSVLASSDVFRLTVTGRPGHGAWPHLSVDPVVVAADLISAIQRIVSRETDPMKPALITIGRIQGGSAVNIIPESVTLEGTVRAYHEDVRAFIAHRLEEVADGVTRSARASYDLSFQRIMPPAVNDPQLADKVRRILQGDFGNDQVTPDMTGAMGCEEFALFQEKIPGLFLFLGKDIEGEPVVPLHDPRYVFPDSILSTGVKAYCDIVLNFNQSDLANK